jgi:hypothetical protein
MKIESECEIKYYGEPPIYFSIMIKHIPTNIKVAKTNIKGHPPKTLKKFAILEMDKTIKKIYKDKRNKKRKYT